MLNHKKMSEFFLGRKANLTVERWPNNWSILWNSVSLYKTAVFCLDRLQTPPMLKMSKERKEMLFFSCESDMSLFFSQQLRKIAQENCSQACEVKMPLLLSYRCLSICRFVAVAAAAAVRLRSFLLLAMRMRVDCAITLTMAILMNAKHNSLQEAKEEIAPK